MNKIVNEFLKRRAFINVATSSPDAKPNTVSKLILKVENNHIYLVDYTFGRTYSNVKDNPRMSLSFFDPERLVGYQINGPVEIVEKGHEYDGISSELVHKEISLATERIIKGVSTGQRHDSYEITQSRKFVIFKVKMEEITEISYSGDIKRERS